MSPAAQFALARQLRSAGGRAARRRLQLRQRPLLPRQAGLRAAVRAAAGSGRSGRRRRRPRDHAERRPARRRHARDAGVASQRLPAVVDRPRATPRTAGRSNGRAARCSTRSAPTARSCCSAASRPASTSRCCCRSSATAVFPPALRRPRRHEPRRPDAALRRGRHRARLRADRRAPCATGSVRRSWRRLGNPHDAAKRCAKVQPDIPTDDRQRHADASQARGAPHQPAQAVLAGARRSPRAP